MFGRRLAFGLGRALLDHAILERYPTRSVEYLLAWVMITWSVRVLWPGQVLSGPTYQYLLVVGPELLWGLLGATVGVIRLYALVRNGRWVRSPMFRLFGATLGLLWWLVIAVLFHIAVETGAPDFPMRAAYPVFIAFELYSCFRCGQDHAAVMKKRNESSAEAEPAESPERG